MKTSNFRISQITCLGYISPQNEEMKHILHCDIAFMMIKHILSSTNTNMMHPDNLNNNTGVFWGGNI